MLTQSYAENLVRCVVDGVPDVLIAGNVEVVMLLISVVEISPGIVILVGVVENCAVIAVFWCRTNSTKASAMRCRLCVSLEC